MTTAPDRRDLLQLLKALADEQRLTLLTRLYDREGTVTELAAALNLSESTISHHLSRLHEAGLLRLRMNGTYRHYRVNEQRLAQFKAYVQHIELAPTPAPVTSDSGWIEALGPDWSETDRKVLREYAPEGRLLRFPKKDSRWAVVLRWLVTRFEPDRTYTEREVNAILTAVHEDYALLRRDLVDTGYLRRERGGAKYWRTPDDEPIPPHPVRQAT